jgi:hypothetical protein
MAFLTGVFEGDFDAFKQRFDSDPLGRGQVATGHTMLRGVDNPNGYFFESSSPQSRTPDRSKKRFTPQTCCRT